MKAFLHVLLGAAISGIAGAQAQTPVLQENWWVTNGTVNAIEVDAPNNRVFLGGSFSVVGPNAPFGAKLTYPGAAPNMGYDKPNGRVRAVVSDNAGGWFIGGDFTMVGIHPLNRVAHILSSGLVDPDWNPDPTGVNATVYALAFDGVSVYVGGEFSSIAGQSRNDLARIDLAGVVSPSFPDNTTGTNSVRCLALDGTTLYAGGDFTSIGTKAELVKINAATNSVDGWDPDPNGTVNALAISGINVFAVGDFTDVNSGAVLRSKAAAFDATTGIATGWDPALSHTAHAVVTDGTWAYIGGVFNTVNATNTIRRKIARFSLSTGTVDTGWIPGAVDPSLTQAVHALAISGSNLAVGGTFESIGAGSHYHMAMVDLSTTTVSPTWTPNPGGTVDCLAMNGLNVFVGGDHACIGGQRWINFLALDRTSGAAAMSWSTNILSGTVQDFLLSGDTLMVGGNFTTIGTFGSTQPRSRLAAINTNDGTIHPWAPSITGTGFTSVVGLTAMGNTLYIGGRFDQVAGMPRNNLAAIDRFNAANVLPWNPDAQNAVSVPVNILANDGSKVYVGGPFTSIGGGATACFCAVDPLNGAVLPGWGAGANGTLSDIKVDGGYVYAAGAFTNIHGATRQYLARLDAATGSVDTQWSPVASNIVLAVRPTPTSVFIGGQFAVVNGAPHPHLAVLSKIDGAVADWDLDINGANVNALAALGSTVFAGGAFSDVLTEPRRSSMAFEDCGTIDHFADGDGDGFGDPGDFTFSCTPPSGYVPNNTDCNDTDPLVYIGATCDDGDPFTTGETINSACVCTDGTIKVAVKAFLQGPFSGGLMFDHYRAFGMLPLTEPYTGLLYPHVGGGGGETMPNSLLLVNGSNAVVDWGVIELRSGTDPASVLHTRSVLFQRDGDIMHYDGGPSVRFNAPPGNYYVAVRHRNHLGAMTLTAVTLGTTAVAVDFTSPTTLTYGATAQVNSGGTMLMWSGDVTVNDVVKYTGSGNDRDPILVRIGGTVPTNTVVGYHPEDVNMDGIVKYTGTNNDRDPILVNVGGLVPTAVRNGGLP